MPMYLYLNQYIYIYMYIHIYIHTCTCINHITSHLWHKCPKPSHQSQHFQQISPVRPSDTSRAPSTGRRRRSDDTSWSWSSEVAEKRGLKTRMSTITVYIILSYH